LATIFVVVRCCRWHEAGELQGDPSSHFGGASCGPEYKDALGFHLSHAALNPARTPICKLSVGKQNNPVMAHVLKRSRTFKKLPKRTLLSALDSQGGD
jgi:hypothetical protein